MKLLEINHCNKKFGDNEVLKDISLSVEEGQVVSIIGPSGSGKSTLLRCATLLETMDGGDLIYLGEYTAKADETGKSIYGTKAELQKARQHFGLVFQNFNLFEHMTARKNVAYALIKVKKMKQDEADKKAVQLLNDVGMGHRVDSYPHQLSGGEKQRVAIARALAMEPEVLLCDEPTSALDPEMTTEVLKVLQRLSHTGLPMIVVTHEMNFAKEVADYILYMDQGQITECSKPEEFFTHAKTERARQFVANML